VARTDNASGWPERQPNPGFTIQTVSGESFPIFKEVLLTLNLGRRPLRMWVFAHNITNEFASGLDILRAYDASLGLGYQTFRLAKEEVSLWSPGARPRPSSLVVAKDQVIPAKCEGILKARLESSLGVESDLVEQSPKTHPPKGFYIATTLVQNRQEVPVRERISSGAL
jgi:hypothetical protein